MCIRDRLYVDLKKAADSPATPLQHKYGDFFAACMNSDLADQLGDKPILPLFARIDAIKDKKEIGAVDAYLDSKTPTGVFFGFGVEQDQKDSTKQIEAVYQGGLTLPDRDYYLEDNPHMKDCLLYTSLGELVESAPARLISGNGVVLAPVSAGVLVEVSAGVSRLVYGAKVEAVKGLRFRGRLRGGRVRRSDVLLSENGDGAEQKNDGGMAPGGLNYAHRLLRRREPRRMCKKTIPRRER